MLRDTGQLDPTSIDDYIALGGYSALVRALEMGPEAVLEEVKRSGLRGRGGAGFPAGRKWEACRNAQGDLRYVVCNADEGDPGAFMDRSILEGNPHCVLEGMTIGAFAMGACEGYVYVRQEYPLAVEHLNAAIEQSRELGLLGDGILGSELTFDVRVSRGGGAFVCGEASAMMASLEGRRGVPHRRLIHLSEKGLWGRPTNVNNVESWANVPHIVLKGADWFRSIGTGGLDGHQDLLARRQGQQHRTRRSADGHDLAPDHLRHRAVASRAARRSRPSRPAVHPAGACRRTSSTCRWTSTPSSPRAP